VKLHPVLLIPLVAACTYDEGIVVKDMTGTVRIPVAAATRTFTHEDGSTETVTDPALIGPVYLGLYPAVVEGLESYTSPAQGPVFQAGVPGDTYPYGGTSIGDIRFSCVEYLKCKVVSGRFVDFDKMVSWFNDTLEQPITTSEGDVVQTGDYVADQCYDLLHYTDDAEIRLTVTEDKNGDGNLDENDLDFVRDGDFFVADFTIWQQEYFQNEDATQGFSLWGWMDAPSEVNAKFTTCDPNSGYQETEYNKDYYAGRPFNDLLNHPAQYIAGGDWVASAPYVYHSPDDENVELTLDFPVEGN
jgi:hypothetical protein